MQRHVRNDRKQAARQACSHSILLSYGLDGKQHRIKERFLGEPPTLLPGLNKDFLVRCIHSKDLLAAQCDVDTLAQSSNLILKYGFAGLKLDALLIKSNLAHCVRSTPHAVVLRGLNGIIRQATQIKPSDRDTIIRRIHTVLSEGVHHRVYKFDIKSFFESLNTSLLYQQLALTPTMPRGALLVLEHFLNELRTRQIVGLPRGVQLSATLSEFALKRFDEEISSMPEVYFHARYVDDIIIITGAREHSADFAARISSLLPGGLFFNSLKTKQVELPVQWKSTSTSAIGQFDYLGYSFSMHETKRLTTGRKPFHRAVDITIAKRKVQRIKSRISLALSVFINDGDVSHLERRLQLLTGNYNMREISTGRKRNVGLYSNYKRANSESGLKELDSFLRAALVGRHSRIARRVASKIPISVRRSLLKYNFEKSFKQRTFYNFSSYDLAELTRCWRNV